MIYCKTLNQFLIEVEDSHTALPFSFYSLNLFVSNREVSCQYPLLPSCSSWVYKTPFFYLRIFFISSVEILQCSCKRLIFQNPISASLTQTHIIYFTTTVAVSRFMYGLRIEISLLTPGTPKIPLHTIRTCISSPSNIYSLLYLTVPYYI